MDDYKFMAAVDYVVHGDFSNASVRADLVAILSSARNEFIERKGFGDHKGLTAFFVAMSKKAAKC